MKKLDELNRALIQVRQGKVPTFDTSLGGLAERLDKMAGALDKQASALEGSARKPYVSHPGSALEEMTTHLQDLRADRLNQQVLRKRLAIDWEQLKQKEAGAARLSASLEKLSSSPLLLPEQRPTVNALWLDSDHLHLAITGCLTSVSRIGKSIDSHLAILDMKIANLQANLNDPNLRSIIWAVDESNASLDSHTSASILDSKAELANQDRANAANTSHALQHPTNRPSPAKKLGNSVVPNLLPPVPRSSGDCPSGFQTVGRNCVRLEMNPY